MFPIELKQDGVFSAELDGFGGFTVGCATLAASRTVEELGLHSIHTCFLRPVPTDRPVLLHVESLSNGRRFARRRVEIRDGDKLLFHLLASFAAPQSGPDFPDDHRGEAPEPPEELPSEKEVCDMEGWELWEDSPFEMRWPGRPWAADKPAESSAYFAWVRPRVPLPDCETRGAAITLLGDFHSHWPVARKLGAHFEPDGYTSLDQSVWIHRDDPWDDFWLFESCADGAHGGRSLGRRTLRTRDGALIASMAQEAMIPGARLLE